MLFMLQTWLLRISVATMHPWVSEHAAAQSSGVVAAPTAAMSPPPKSVLRQTPYVSPLAAVYVLAGDAPLAQGPEVPDPPTVAIAVVVSVCR